MGDFFRGLLNEVAHDSANSMRDRASWEGANMVERATFGRIFNAISGILGVIALFGCFLIASVTQNSKFFTYLCGVLWLVPFIGAGVLLARFRHRLFVRVRQIMNNYLGGGRF